MAHVGGTSQSALEEILRLYFYQHPSVTINAQNEPVLPAVVLMEALGTLTTTVGPTGVSIFKPQETEKLKLILASNSGFRVTPAILRGFIGFSSPHDVEQLRAEIRFLQEENAGLLAKLAKNREQFRSDEDVGLDLEKGSKPDRAHQLAAFSILTIASAPTLQQSVDTPTEQSDQPPAYDDDRRVDIRQSSGGPQPNCDYEASEEGRTGVDHEAHCENSVTFVDKASQTDLEGTHDSSSKIDAVPQCRCFSTKSIITIVGGAVLLHLLMWSAVFAPTHALFAPLGGLTYQDRRLWNSFNTEYPTGEGIMVSQARCVVGVSGFSDWTTAGARDRPSPT